MPFRKLGDENSLGGAQAYNRVAAELVQLPDNTQLTKDICGMDRMSGIFVTDGKFVKVRGFEEKIPCVYGLDYLTHDPIANVLAPSESVATYRKLFQKLKDMEYPLKAVVCDDRGAVETALKGIYPLAKIQLCQNHYLENIRKLLHIRTDETYHHFFNSLKLHVFTEPKTEAEVVTGLRHVWDNHAKDNQTLRMILLDIRDRMSELFARFHIPNCPNTTNIIELYNSHIQARLKSIKGFKSFPAADVWLNGYFIRRRTKHLTDCQGKFKPLNGHASLELTIKKQAQWPEQLTKLGIKKLNYFEPNEKPEQKSG